MADQHPGFFYADKYKVPGDKEVRLKDWLTDDNDKPLSKEDGEKMLQSDIQKLSDIQEKLYASNRYSVLIVIQAMDAAGKDSVVKHVMSGLNPQGVNVTSFKTPTHQELEHDYLWRHYIALPSRGMVGIFNRSHYENVLVTRVHPEYILYENLPGIHAVTDIDKTFWVKRFKQINHFEKPWWITEPLSLNFFFTYLRKNKKNDSLSGLLIRLKTGKFSSGDLKERALWKDYRKAYEEMLENTSNIQAPWFVVPADDKWFTRYVIANIIINELNKVDLSYPQLTDQQKKDLELAKKELTGEADSPANDNEQ